MAGQAIDLLRGQALRSRRSAEASRREVARLRDQADDLEADAARDEAAANAYEYAASVL